MYTGTKGFIGGPGRALQHEATTRCTDPFVGSIMSRILLRWDDDLIDFPLTLKSNGEKMPRRHLTTHDFVMSENCAYNGFSWCKIIDGSMLSVGKISARQILLFFFCFFFRSLCWIIRSADFCGGWNHDWTESRKYPGGSLDGLPLWRESALLEFSRDEYVCVFERSLLVRRVEKLSRGVVIIAVKRGQSNYEQAHREPHETLGSVLFMSLFSHTYMYTRTRIFEMYTV